MPIGTISHLIGDVAGMSASPTLRSAVEFSAITTEKLKSSERWNVAVFAIDSISEIVRDRGSSFVNELLALLYELIVSEFEGRAVIGQLGSGEMGILVADDAVEKFKARSENITVSVRRKYGGRFSVGAGVSGKGMSTVKADKKDRSELKDDFALEYARYSASPSARKPGVVAAFSALTAFSIVYSQRNAGQHQRALVDYARFKEVGVNYPDLDNLAGICHIEAREPNWEAAGRLFSVATESNSKDPSFWANLGLARFHLKDRPAAATAFQAAFAINGQLDLGLVYAGPLILSYYDQFRAGGNMPIATLRSWFAWAQKKRGDRKDWLSTEIDAALAEL